MKNKEQLVLILDAMLNRLKFIERVQRTQKAEITELRELVVDLYYEVRHRGIQGPPGPMGPQGATGMPGRDGECNCKPFWKRLFKGTNSTGPGSRVNALYKPGPY